MQHEPETLLLSSDEINALGRESFGADWVEPNYRICTDAARHFARAIESAVLARIAAQSDQGAA